MSAMGCQYQVAHYFMGACLAALDDLNAVYHRMFDDDIEAVNYVEVFEVASAHMCIDLVEVLRGFSVYVGETDTLEEMDAARAWHIRGEILAHAVQGFGDNESVERMKYAALIAKTVRIWVTQPMLISEWSEGMAAVIASKEEDAFTDETE